MQMPPRKYIRPDNVKSNNLKDNQLDFVSQKVKARVQDHYKKSDHKSMACPISEMNPIDGQKYFGVQKIVSVVSGETIIAVKSLIDTGSAVTIINESVWNDLNTNGSVTSYQKANRYLLSVTGQELSALGKVWLTLRFSETDITVSAFVTKDIDP